MFLLRNEVINLIHITLTSSLIIYLIIYAQKKNKSEMMLSDKIKALSDDLAKVFAWSDKVASRILRLEELTGHTVEDASKKKTVKKQTKKSSNSVK
jgi:hypothetical protein